MEALDEAAEQRRNAARDLSFGELAIREARAVGGIDDRRIGQQLARRFEHRQAADPGIEEKDGGVGVHAWDLAWSGRRRKLRCGYGLLLTPRMTREMLFVLALGYVLGSIPFGLVLTRLAGKGDVRKIGSGNIGATNVLRTGSKWLAAPTLILDCLKATAAILLAQLLFGDETGITLPRAPCRASLSRLDRLSRREGSCDFARRSLRCFGRRRWSMPASGFSCLRRFEFRRLPG